MTRVVISPRRVSSLSVSADTLSSLALGPTLRYRFCLMRLAIGVPPRYLVASWDVFTKTRKTAWQFFWDCFLQPGSHVRNTFSQLQNAGAWALSSGGQRFAPTRRLQGPPH